MQKLVFSFGLLFITAVFVTTVQAQVLGAIAGTVKDAAGAVVPGATVTVKGEAGQEFTATTNDDGTYRIPAVAAGFYTATITAPNFKTLSVQNIKVDVGTPATVDGVLEAGAISETVVVTSGAEVLQTQTATVGTNIQGRQILETPIQSRDALDLVTLLPGTNTVGTVRTSSINGLPKGAISITIDGVDVQDNLLRSSDGFFTFVRPRIDAIDEVTVSTANPGAESAGDGAVQIAFATRRGTNDYRGSAFWQHRDEGLNANNWWNNRVNLPRQKLRLNQFGGRIGGPVPFFRFGDGDGPLFHSGKDRAFFFVNYEEYRIPEASPTRVRTILNPTAQTGVFAYDTTIAAGNPVPSFCSPTSGTTYRCTPNLLTFAAANGLPGTIDPTVGALLNSIRSAASSTGTLSTLDLNRQTLSFVNTGSSNRKFFTVRGDVEVKGHSVGNVFNYQPFRSTVDFLNAVDPQFPGFANAGTQNSDRYSNSFFVRSTIGEDIVNEARFATLWGTSDFAIVGGDEWFDVLQRGYNLNFETPLGISEINALPNVFTPSSRTSPTYDFTDNLTWIAGNHTFAFGGQHKTIYLKNTTFGNYRPIVTLGSITQDTQLQNFFTAARFGDTAPLATLANFYAGLTGRIANTTQTGYLSPDGQYIPSGPLYRKVRQQTFGVYAQDTWRVRPNLTISMGLRWQPQTGYEMLTQNFTRLENFDMVYDVSGPGNLFSPGTLTGVVPKYIGNQPGEKAFDTDWNNLAPSVGVVYSPDFGSGFMRTLFGEYGRSVIRGGFSRSFVREGTNIVLNTLGQHPGGTISLSRNVTLGNFTPGTLFGTPGNPNLVTPAFNPTPQYPITANPSFIFAAIDPDLETGYVDSWSIGYQREIDRNTVVEVRYVGNRGNKMLNVYNLNEVNAIENGFGAEFRLAQQNLLSNIACAATAGCTGGGTHFRYRGPGTGTSPLPIIVSYIAGAADPNATASYSSALFANATLYNTLAPTNPNVQGLASLLDANFRATGLAAGRPINFFQNCPTNFGFCIITDNSEKSWYDAAVVEVRRRLSAGVRFQASYTYGKAFTNTFASAGTSFYGLGAGDQSNASNNTLRNRDLDKSFAQVDIRHAFKFDATWDLPFGKGRSFLGNSNWAMNALVGGWSLNPVIRWQSGAPALLENVQLVGMTADEFQDMIGVYKDSVVSLPGQPSVQAPTWLPPDVILNTIRAFNTVATTATGYSTLGVPTGKFIAPAGYGNCQFRSLSEVCGFRKLVVYGPDFFKADLAVIKRIQFDEKRNVEFRVTMFDILNKTNWRLGAWTGNVNNVTGFGATNFGQYLSGWTYQDPFGSNDPGGRIVDLMLRINF